MKPAWLLLFILLLNEVSAQPLTRGDWMSAPRSAHYFRFEFENDFVSATDYYYTGGMGLEWASPLLENNPVNRIFPQLKNGRAKWALALDQYGFTPTHIVAAGILYGDRPYAGILAMTSSRTMTDPAKKLSLITSLTAGVIGPMALGRETQSTFHRVIKDPKPLGWKHQVRNDVVLNYGISLSKNVLNTPLLKTITTVEANVGTLHTRAGAGAQVTLGKMIDPYAALTNGQLIQQFYFYAGGKASVIGYDASLQGGMINRNSPYVIRSGELERLVAEARIGMVLQVGNLFLDVSKNFISKEFKTGLPHSWGHAGIATMLH